MSKPSHTELAHITGRLLQAMYLSTDDRMREVAKIADDRVFNGKIGDSMTPIMGKTR